MGRILGLLTETSCNFLKSHSLLQNFLNAPPSIMLSQLNIEGYEFVWQKPGPSPHFCRRSEQQTQEVWQSWYGREECGIPDDVAAASWIESHVSGHHHLLVLLLRFGVDDDGVDGVLLDFSRELACVAHHGVEANLVWTAGTFQMTLGGVTVKATHGAPVSGVEERGG